MIVKITSLSLFLLFLVVSYVGVHGYRDYRIGEAAKAKGDLTTAVTHYHRSIKWYLPGAFYVTRAAEGLWQVGMEAERKGDTVVALTAYQELRSGFYAARSFYTPGKEWIEKCDQKIATLMARWEASLARGKESPSIEALSRKHLAILGQKGRPDYFWSIILELGFFGWLGSTIGFVMQVFLGEKGFNNKRALGWGIVFLISYFLWITGMLKA